MAQRAVKDPAFAITEDKCHRIIFAVYFRASSSQHIDRAVTGQACVQLIFNLEGFQALCDGMGHISNIDSERPSGIVRPCLWVPDPAGKITKLGPVLESTASKMDYE